MGNVSTILVAIAWLGVVVLNGPYALSSPSSAEKTEHAPAKQSTCRCSGCSISDGEIPEDSGEDRTRPLGAPSCPGGCPVCACTFMLPLPTWSPDSHHSTSRRLATDDVVADSGYVRKDIDPPRV